MYAGKALMPEPKDKATCTYMHVHVHVYTYFDMNDGVNGLAGFAAPSGMSTEYLQNRERKFHRLKYNSQD